MSNPTVRVSLSDGRTHTLTAFPWRDGWHCAPPVSDTHPVYATPRDAALAHARLLCAEGVYVEAAEMGADREGAAMAAHIDESLAQRNLAVTLAVAAEREACALLCAARAAKYDAASPEDYTPGDDEGDDERYGRFVEALEIAEAIRARGATPPTEPTR